MANSNPKPVPPAQRGRRGHKLIDRVPGLKAWMVGCFQRTPRPTAEDIREELKGTGFWQKLQELGHEEGIAPSTIWSYWVDFEAAVADKELSIGIAALYNQDAAGGGGPLEIETHIATMLLVDSAKDIAARVSKGESVPEFLYERNRKLIVAAAQLKKAKHLIERGRRDAIEEMRALFTEKLSKRPAVLRDVSAIFDEMEKGDPNA